MSRIALFLGINLIEVVINPVFTSPHVKNSFVVFIIREHISYLELEVDTIDMRTREEWIDNLLVIHILIRFGFYGIRDGLSISSANYEDYEEISLRRYTFCLTFSYVHY